MKRHLLIACLAFATLAGAQDLSKPITYRTVAIPLHSALDQISKQAGINLGVTDEFQNEPIILSIHGATTKETMDHIAAALGAEWKKRSPTEYLLTRTDDIETELEKHALDLREATIKKAVDRLVKEQDDGETPEIYAQKTAQALASGLKLINENRGTSAFNAVQGRYPGHRALVALLRTLTPRQIAEIGPGEKVVLSTAPNSVQQLLPDSARDVIDQFTEDQNLLADAFAKAYNGPIKRDLTKRFAKRIGKLSSPPAKLLLIIHGTQFLMGSPSVTFLAVNAGGKAVGYGREQLTVDPIRKTWAMSAATLSAAAKDPEIPLSPESHIFSDLCESLHGKLADPPPLSPSQQEMLCNPEQRDPLSFLVSDGFLALADKTKGNLVACPSDNLFFVNFQKSEDKSFKLAKFLDTLQQQGIDVETNGDWTTAVPFDPIDASKARTNRELLGDCLREAASKGCISIDTAGKLALSEDLKRGSDLPWVYSLFGQKYCPFMERDEHLLRLYESLSTAQVNTLRSGGSIHPGDLSKDQWVLMDDLAYSGRIGLTSAPVDEYGDSGDYVLEQEPTELLPDGLPADAAMTMKATDKDILFAGVDLGSGNVYPEEATLDDIASMIAAHEAGVKADFDADVQWICGGHVQSLDFEFMLTQSLKGSGSLREVTRDDKRWTLANLPTDLKDRLNAAIVAARAKLDKTQQDPKPTPGVQPPFGVRRFSAAFVRML